MALLDATCAADAELRAEVESLLAADTSADAVDALAEGWLGEWHEPGPSRVGESIGPYRILEEIGAGGMGTVYLAERDDDHFRHRVALKVLRAGAGDVELQRRFRTERQVLALLEHPRIARLYDGGVTADGRPWFAMEHVAGRSLDRWCREEEPSVARRLELVIQACQAVQYAHRRMIVHRDLKPSNILVTADGEVRLLDFGIAKLLDSAESGGAAFTRTDARPMTPGYASPEQVLGRPVSAASDVYSLGVVLYELLAGRRPYDVENLTPAELERVVCHEDPPPPSAVVPAGPGRRALCGDLDTIVGKALAKEPARRYATPEALADDLQRFLDRRPIHARPSTASYRIGKFVRRHRWGVIAGAAAALSLVAGIAGTAWQAREARSQARAAARERDRAQRVSEMLMELFESADPIAAGTDTLSARALLDRGRTRLEADLEDDPAVRATLALTMGGAYRNLGLFDEAESLFVMSLRERRALAGGRDDVAVGEALTQVGNVLLDRGRAGEAVERFREALAILAADLSVAPAELATAHDGLGAALDRMGAPDSALVQHRIALDILRREGIAGPRLAITLSNLGAAYRRAGDLPSAASALEEAVAIHRRDAPGSASLAMALNNLASLRSKQDDLVAAESLLRESLDIRRAVYGEHHALVATSRNNLAGVLKQQGKLDDAERLYREVLAERRAAFGDVHPAVAQSLNNLGMLVRERGDLDEAERLLRESLAIRRRVHRDAQPELALAIYNLGRLMQERGRMTEAEALLREALDMRRAPGAGGADDARSTAQALARLLESTGRKAEADSIRSSAS